MSGSWPKHYWRIVGLGCVVATFVSGLTSHARHQYFQILWRWPRKRRNRTLLMIHTWWPPEQVRVHFGQPWLTVRPDTGFVQLCESTEPHAASISVDCTLAANWSSYRSPYDTRTCSFSFIQFRGQIRTARSRTSIHIRRQRIDIHFGLARTRKLICRIIRKLFHEIIVPDSLQLMGIGYGEIFCSA